ncbi:hypothetical protein BDV40DRAFT_291863 [Aspergillus tamarii]|uniref:Uncharacterized protein n=1 Tax=Aspergillus tamarii TaxID=41984 RepID=A0A5N6UI86_ASPTM|nr:hypothetical protein BDV40DRAFT_291863 [Aspergillus tamarii]
MSVTIHSKGIGIGRLIPRVIYYETEDSNVANKACTFNWPGIDCKFNFFLYELYNFHVELEVYGPKSWKIATREYSRSFTRAQCSMSRVLMENIHFNLECLKEQGPRVQFMTSPRELKYTIGGNRYRTRVEGAAIVGPRAQYLPIISFTGTWNEFLMETYCTMLGQLTRNLSILQTGFEDQEVFIVGFHRPYLHITHRYFPEGLITRAFSLKFTPGYNLCFKEDWLEVICVLSRLLRYIISGKVKVGAVQVNM